VYDTSIANGAYGWVVVAGVAHVQFTSSGTAPTHGYHCWVDDTAGQDGKADCSLVVSTARHWAEIGHCIESASLGSLAKCVLHFN
jgi:hypothetical protein